MHRISPVLACLYLAAQVATAQSPSELPFCAVEPQAVQLLDFTQNTLEVTSTSAEVQHDQGYHIKFTEVEGNVTWSAPKGGWDWSEYVGIDLKNESDRIVQLVGQLQESPNSGSFMLLPPGAANRLVVFLRCKGLPDDSPFADMRVMPGGHMAHWSIPDPKNIRSFQLRDIDGCALNTTIALNAVYGLGKHRVLSHPETTEFFPFVNQFGQYKHSDWGSSLFLVGKATQCSDFNHSLRWRHGEGLLAIRDLRRPLFMDGSLIEEELTKKIIGAAIAVQTYMQLTECRVGLLMHFNVPVLKDGIKPLLL